MILKAASDKFGTCSTNMTGLKAVIALRNPLIQPQFQKKSIYCRKLCLIAGQVDWFLIRRFMAGFEGVSFLALRFRVIVSFAIPTGATLSNRQSQRSDCPAPGSNNHPQTTIKTLYNTKLFCRDYPAQDGLF